MNTEIVSTVRWTWLIIVENLLKICLQREIIERENLTKGDQNVNALIECTKA